MVLGWTERQTDGLTNPPTATIHHELASTKLKCAKSRYFQDFSIELVTEGRMDRWTDGHRHYRDARAHLKTLSKNCRKNCADSKFSNTLVFNGY